MSGVFHWLCCHLWRRRALPLCWCRPRRLCGDVGRAAVVLALHVRRVCVVREGTLSRRAAAVAATRHNAQQALAGPLVIRNNHSSC